ncbi:MAG: pantetheine-phosphate adenylyltransferase [bacterium]
MRKAIYPGTFDPITKGHLDLVLRGLRLFDEVIVAVAANTNKRPLFSLEERKDMIEQCLAHVPRVTVISFHGLLVDFAREQKVQAIIRGLRAISDYESELQMALVNRKLGGEIETVFLTPKANYIYLSSSVVRELASLGGCINDMVEPYVKEKLEEKFRK